MQEQIAELTRQRLSEAIFLMGFGIVWALDLWWPGLLVTFGAAWTASLLLRRRLWPATVVVVLLCALPAGYSAAQSWDPLLPFAVVGLGAAGVVRAIFRRGEGQTAK